MALGTIKKGAAAKPTSTFKYQRRTPEQAKARATQQGGSRENIFHDHVKLYNPKAGEHDIRFLPPTWDNPEHFGFDVWLHFGIGPDENQYVCVSKMKNEQCAACDERAKAEKEGAPDAKDISDALKPGRRVAAWIIDRKNEKEGPLLWPMPWTFDRDSSTLMTDKKTGEIYELDNPDEGYDVSFSVQGEKLTKKYIGIQIARRATALTDDPDRKQQWLDYISENPIPDVVAYRDYETLLLALSGGVRGVEGSDKRGKSKPEADKPVRGAVSKKEPDPEPAPDEVVGSLFTWDDVQVLSADEIEVVVKEAELDENAFADCESVEQLRVKLCELLGIEAPPPAVTAGGKPSLKERLAAMKAGRK